MPTPEHHEFEGKLRKINRIRKLTPKGHKIVHESGRSTKKLWRIIIERAQRLHSEPPKNRRKKK